MEPHLKTSVKFSKKRNVVNFRNFVSDVSDSFLQLLKSSYCSCLAIDSCASHVHSFSEQNEKLIKAKYLLIGLGQ